MPIVNPTDYQYPDLPVEVTDGKLGSNTAYDDKNWRGEHLWISQGNDESSIINDYYGTGEGAGDLLIICGKYANTDYNVSVTFNSETNVNRLNYTYRTNPYGNDEAYFWCIWELTASFGSTTNVEVTLGPGAYHDYNHQLYQVFSEYY